jgi:hypothetical protein
LFANDLRVTARKIPCVQGNRRGRGVADLRDAAGAAITRRFNRRLAAPHLGG